MNTKTVKYELLDFGAGRKLESIGDYRIDRPSPAAAAHRKANPAAWKDVGATFDSEAKHWIFHQPWPEDQVVDCHHFRMPVRPTPFGHIGIFPEQMDNWQWLARRAIRESTTDQPLWGLNLFGYTGASTLAMASAGLSVAHVDAAKPNVESAKSAAGMNGWQDHPIRYLVDDAAKFASREVRRGRQYQTVVLDPPAYGHSPRGKAWRLERDLWPLLDDCLRLLADPPSSGGHRLLVTGHSPDIGCGEVADYLHRWSKSQPVTIQIDASRSCLTDRGGRKLDAGFQVRVLLISDRRTA